MSSEHDRLVRYLSDAHAAEVGYRKMFEAFIRPATDQNLCLLYQEQVQLSRLQEDRLEKCLHKFGAQTSEVKDIANTIFAKIGDVIHSNRDAADQTVQDLLKAYGLAQAGKAMYESLSAYASQLGTPDIPDVAEAAKREKEEAAERIWPMIGKFARAIL